MKPEKQYVEDIVHEHFDMIFDEVIEVVDDRLYDLVVEIKLDDGRTVRKSWMDRERRLSDTR